MERFHIFIPAIPVNSTVVYLYQIAKTFGGAIILEARILKPEEKVYLDRLDSICFAYADSEDYEKKLENPLEHCEGYERAWGGFDDNGNLCAGLVMVPYAMQFDGKTVGMYGIGSVATLPEARSSGVMSVVLNQCLRHMREKGLLFSTLYPFSYSYYRKFGYELAYRINKAEIPIEAFSGFPFPKGQVHHIKKSDFVSKLPDLKQIYNSFKTHRNYAITRDDKRWEELAGKDPYRTLHYTYICYDKENIPSAYLLFHKEVGEPGGRHTIVIDELVWSGGRHTVAIDEMAWSNENALWDMFGFIGGLSPQFGQVKWNVPDGIDVFSIFPEAWDISLTREASLMTRILDLPSVLSIMKVPNRPSRRVVLDVKDKVFPENTGKYEVSWEGGVISVSTTDKSADMETSIETMAQLVTGYITPSQAIYKTDTVIHSQLEALQSLFPRKDLYIIERF